MKTGIGLEMGIELAMLSLKYLIENQVEMSDSNWSIFGGQVWRSNVSLYIPSKSVYDWLPSSLYC